MANHFTTNTIKMYPRPTCFRFSLSDSRIYTHFRCESPEDSSILILLQSTTTDHRNVAECTLGSPYSAIKLPCSPNTSPAVVHHGTDSSRMISALFAEASGAPFGPVTFPRPFDPRMSRRTPFVSMIWVVGDQLSVYLLSPV